MAGTTNTELLAGLHDPANCTVWEEFCARYRPVLIAFAGRLGLHEQDAEDAAQETLLAFACGYRDGRYDRTRGRLRTWLYGIAAHKIRDLQRQGCKERPVADASNDTGILERIPDDHSMSELWEAEWKRALLKACVDEVRNQVGPSSMEVFELTVVKQWPADRAATHLGMSRDAVLRARGRVLSRIREARRRLESDW